MSLTRDRWSSPIDPVLSEPPFFFLVELSLYCLKLFLLTSLISLKTCLIREPHGDPFLKLGFISFPDSGIFRKHKKQIGAVVVDSDWHERRRLLPTMARIEYGRFESGPTLPRFRHEKKKIEKPRQEICAPLKWTCFLINFIVFVSSLL